MRKAGVLLPLFALPGSMGIGDLGLSAYKWVDMLASSNASLWQILPLNPVGYGNSPYQTYSSLAGDEIYISIEDLYTALDLKLDIGKIETSRVDYESVRKTKEVYLTKAYLNFKESAAYKDFLKQAYWLDDYVEFITLKKQNQMKSWLEWTNFKLDDDAMEYERFIQYIFYTQWNKLKAYANFKGVEIFGDIPFYVGHDSAEVYFNQESFYLNEDGSSKLVAGVPPDYFSDEGQLWGNPIYDWIKIAENDYQLWIERLAWNQRLFDVIRLDHFRAFDTFWVIDAKEMSAKTGEWRLGPSYNFFNKIYESIPNLNIVAEDLGLLRPEVLLLRDKYDLMGMKIIQFSLLNREIEADRNIDSNLVAYTGTHDNIPIKAFVDNIEKERQDELMKLLPKYSDSLEETLIYYCLSLNTDWAILPVQDILNKGIETLWNSPGSVGSPNWEWKLSNFNELDSKMVTFKEMVNKSKRNQ